MFKVKMKEFFGKRALFILPLALIITIILVTTIQRCRKPKVDTNTYLNEEICFADEIYFKANSINVIENNQDSEIDEDGDLLSSYTLNIGLVVEQRHTDKWTNKVEISPKNFKLKSINLKAKSKMEVFIGCLAKESLSILIGGSISGSVNVIEETLNFSTDYLSDSLENIDNCKVDFKPIKCIENSFDPFYPYGKSEPTNITVSFPIKKEYLDSKNIICLAIDDILHFEKRIYLTLRPTTNNT